MSRHVTHSLAALTISAGAALAAWPTSASEPLSIGKAQGDFGPRIAVAQAQDDAIWISWQDSFCEGDLRLQRLEPDASVLAPFGLAVQRDPTCGFVLPPSLAVSADTVVLARALADAHTEQALAFDHDGVQLWQSAGDTVQGDALVALTTLESGDTLVVTQNFGTIHLDRLDATGARVWPERTAIDSPSGANFRIFAVVPDPTGGAFVFWDSPLSYIRTIWVNRVAADGSLPWPATVRPILPPPLDGNSRHTDPIALADGQGAAWLVYTEGREQGSTPVPTRVQRVNPDGTLAFPLEGLRISTAPERQFDPRAIVDPDTGDLYVAWQDDFLDGAAVRAQRLTRDGTRLWSDTGIEVSPDGTRDFDLSIWDGRFTVTTAYDSADFGVDPDGVTMHAFDTDGVRVGTWPLGDRPAASVRVLPSADGAIAIWQDVPATFQGELVAQRVNPGGRLGDPACNAADLAEPFGVLDLADLGAFVTAFVAGDHPADLVPPAGVFDLADVQAFVAAFTAGCP